jgi:hypothetical protein
MPEIEGLFAPSRFRAALLSAAASSSPGPDGLRYRHLQQALYAGGALLAPLGRLAALLFAAPGLLPPLFWRLHSAARLVALGDTAKVRPVAVGGTIRRLVGRVFVRAYAPHLEELFAADGQFGVGSPAGAETVAMLARLCHEGDSWLLAVDGTNAFNSALRAAILPAAAALLDRAFSYIAALYGGPPPHLLVQLPGGAGVTVVPSASGVQQGDAFGPTLFCLALLPVLRRLREHWGERGITAFGLMDDIYLAGRPGTVVAQGDLADAFQELREGLEGIGVAVNVAKSAALPPLSLRAAAAAAAAAGAQLPLVAPPSLPALPPVAYVATAAPGLASGSPW